MKLVGILFHRDISPLILIVFGKPVHQVEERNTIQDLVHGRKKDPVPKTVTFISNYQPNLNMTFSFQSFHSDSILKKFH